MNEPRVSGPFASRFGPWAVVTGASSGIGRELALRLAESGLHLVLVSRRRSLLEELAREVTQTNGVEARVLAVDLGQRDQLRQLVEATEGLDVGLFVGAAGFGSAGPFIEAALEQELDMVDVNCRAIAELSWVYARRFVERGGGGLVLLSSVVGFQGTPYAANYAATKAYVQSLAEGLRVELAPHGVAVVASAPGPIRSGFAQRAGMRMGLAQTPKAVAQTTLDALGASGTVRPGFLSKLLGYSLATLPRWGRVRVMGRVMKGMVGPPET